MDMHVEALGYKLIKHLENHHASEIKGRLEGKVSAIIYICCQASYFPKTLKEIYTPLNIEERILS